jgi:hypothetical protein
MELDKQTKLAMDLEEIDPSQVCWYTPVISDRVRNIMIWAQPRQKHETLYKKQTKKEDGLVCGSNAYIAKWAHNFNP